MQTACCSAGRVDRFAFTVSGHGAQALFSLAAQQGIPLYGVRCAGDGYTAWALGRDQARVRALAERRGWRFAVVRRPGAARLAGRLLRRPGVPLGFVACLVLLRLLAGYVWCIDLAGLDPARQQTLRGLLDANGIREGARLTQSGLMQAQQALSLHGGEYGWLSLNFTGGCLFVETADREQQRVRADPAGTALYAKAGGEVLAVEVESGFAAVVPGQYVAPGQLLAAAARADHDGAPVTQAAAGRILARVTMEFSAEQPLQTQQTVLTGRSTAEDSLCLLGHQWVLREPAARYAAAMETRSWLPVRLGQISLPASLCRTQRWEQKSRTLCYSEEAAAALARRACRLQLEQKFPGAVVETQTVHTEMRDGKALCAARYVFTADIAQAEPDRGEMAP